MQSYFESTEVKMQFDYKGGKINIKEFMPKVDDKEEYYIQYFGIWQFLFSYTDSLKAKTVLEFGTREGYSTRLFAEVLRLYKGTIHTVDKDPVKNPDDFSKWDNIVFHQSLVEDFEWKEPVDILYIDDWHNPWHLYYELNKFGHSARVVMVHDVSLERNNDLSLLKAVEEWCHQNMYSYSVFPINGCGLAIINVEESKNFYDSTYRRRRTPGELAEATSSASVGSQS